jgi:hypothetical protein
MEHKLYIGLPYSRRMEVAPHGAGVLGFQVDERPVTDGDMLEVTFRDGKYDPTTVVIHEGEEE